MKTTTILFCLLLMAVYGSFAKAETHTWTTVSGASLEAEFVSLSMDVLTLRDNQDTLREIGINKLVADDQKLARSLSNPVLSGKTTGEEQSIPPVLEELFGKRLVNAKKNRHSTAELSGRKIGIYFSAHWCPPCRKFTPLLVDTYNKLQEEGKPFEIVFVSSDRDQNAMHSYMKEANMPWLALPFGSKQKDVLSGKFNVRSIPRLVVIDDQGKVLSDDARGQVARLGAAAFDQLK